MDTQLPLKPYNHTFSCTHAQTRLISSVVVTPAPEQSTAEFVPARLPAFLPRCASVNTVESASSRTRLQVLWPLQGGPLLLTEVPETRLDDAQANLPPTQDQGQASPAVWPVRGEEGPAHENGVLQQAGVRR